MVIRRRRILLIVLITIVVVAIAYMAQVLWRHSITFSLQPSSVKRGNSFTIVTTFRNEIPDGVRYGSAISVVDANGREWYQGQGSAANSGFTEPVTEEMCGGDFLGTPPHFFKRTNMVTVLSQTPPGTYTVRIPANRFCITRNAATTLTLKITE